jgi:hypothetical protein
VRGDGIEVLVVGAGIAGLAQTHRRDRSRAPPALQQDTPLPSLPKTARCSASLNSTSVRSR